MTRSWVLVLPRVVITGSPVEDAVVATVAGVTRTAESCGPSVATGLVLGSVSAFLDGDFVSLL
jgi:hypothetical protein